MHHINCFWINLGTAYTGQYISETSTIKDIRYPYGAYLQILAENLSEISHIHFFLGTKRRERETY